MTDRAPKEDTYAKGKRETIITRSSNSLNSTDGSQLLLLILLYIGHYYNHDSISTGNLL